MRDVLFALIVISGFVSAAGAQTVRFICTNSVGAPERFEVDFGRKTVLAFNNDQGTIKPEDTSTPAIINETTISWPETFGGDIIPGAKYSIERATGVLIHSFEGNALYTKQCRKLPPGSDWQ
ncbi:MAG: hypothetical protein WAK26_14090 [Terracidiphilus sp.]